MQKTDLTNHSSRRLRATAGFRRWQSGKERWLSREAGISFYDRIPTEAEKQAETAPLLEQLASTGEFGRSAVRIIARTNRDKSGD